MSAIICTNNDVRVVEALMLDHFRDEPFHNLHYLYDFSPKSSVPGGTCSDKTLSFVRAGLRVGLNVSLHTGFIKGKEMHRLARVHVDGRMFFADVGNGWPALKLYPADREISYRCFGMGFRTEISQQKIAVFHEKQGKEMLQLEIDVKPKAESAIMEDINQRFSSGLVYPFSNGIRFSQVVDNRFLFLRGNTLEIYGDHSFECVEEIEEARVPMVLHDYFGLDMAVSAKVAMMLKDNVKE